MNFREWSNPDNWYEDGNPKNDRWRVYRPGQDDRLDAAIWAMAEPRLPHRFKPIHADEETIDLMMDHLERQFPVEFNKSDKQFLHSVGMSHV